MRAGRSPRQSRPITTTPWETRPAFLIRWGIYGRVTDYTYDNRYRSTQEIWKTSGGATVRTIDFTLDAAGQMTAASDPSGSLSYVYDALGRITSETQTIAGLTPTLAFANTYDANSNRLTLASTIGGTADFKNTYVYDNLDRMTRVVQEDVTGGNVVADKRVDFQYNALSQFTQLDRYQSTGTSNLVGTTTFAYDGLNRLAEMDHKQGATTLAGYDYTYDVGSRITSINSFLDGLSTYTYDNTDQLKTADHTGQTDESYSYDENGNRTMTGYVVGNNNRTTNDGTYTYEYDDEGNRTKRTKISDGSYEEYTWDHRNRLTKVTFKNSGGTVLKTVEQSYDMFDRWIRRSLDSDGPGPGAAVDTFFAYEGDSINPVLQFSGPSASNLDHRYLRGPVVDQILADEDVSSLTQAGNPIWLLTDHLGTANDLADFNESTSVTTIANHREFNSFGALTVESNPSVSSDIRYTGKLFDASTGLNQHYHRWLDVLLGQWISEDPIGFAARDSNLRRYVGNHPSLTTDSSGLQEPGFDPDNPHAFSKKPPPPTTGKPNGMSQQEFEDKVRLAESRSHLYTKNPLTPLAARLHRIWRSGRGGTHNLPEDDLKRIMATQGAKERMRRRKYSMRALFVFVTVEAICLVLAIGLLRLLEIWHDMPTPD
jgi:RHS repeat-associated protein